MRRGRLGGIIFTAVVVLFALYALDPFLFSYHRGQAIRAYLYLHNYGDDRQAAALADCGLLRPAEVRDLNRRQGAFQDYFAGTGPAENAGDGTSSATWTGCGPCTRATTTRFRRWTRSAIFSS